uniref:Uncharacterized protein n=1 Tax=Anguilla anguilla TaxID=7936 RepID=A0A0E9V1V3_ANGAN
MTLLLQFRYFETVASLAYNGICQNRLLSSLSGSLGL